MWPIATCATWGRPVSVAMILQFLVFGCANAVAESDQSLAPNFVPTPSLTPQDVVRIQLGALADNDRPYADAGIELTFRFASPKNKRMTGPLQRFIHIVRNPVYAPMIDHLRAEFGATDIIGARALVSVVLTASDLSQAAYVFSLSQQQGGEYDRCWMTDSVTRFRVPNLPDKSTDGIEI